MTTTSNSRLTLRKINAELKRRGETERLVRGRGYYYFIEGTSYHWPSVGVYTSTLVQDLEFWMRAHSDLKGKCDAKQP